MKKSNLLLSLAMITVTLFTACQNENALVSQPEVPSALADSMRNAAGKSTTNANTTTNSTEIPSFTESDVDPKFGKPNATTYSFRVYELSGKLALSVKLYEKATGDITYIPMSRVGNYWVLSTKIKINGWYDWRYVYSVSKSNISDNAYKLCNTNNVFGNSTNSLTWPFGADGSSWTHRTVKPNWLDESWGAGSEGFSGNGPGEGAHTGYREYYSDDWNRGIGNMDFGAEIRSPLDGYIEECGSYSTSIGKSKFVSIIQYAPNGRIYRFYVAHIDEVGENIREGRYVRAGVTKIATLGNSGASLSHAHCNLRDETNGDDKSVKFTFDAQ